MYVIDNYNKSKTQKKIKNGKRKRKRRDSKEL